MRFNLQHVRPESTLTTSWRKRMAARLLQAIMLLLCAELGCSAIGLAALAWAIT